MQPYGQIVFNPNPHPRPPPSPNPDLDEDKVTQEESLKILTQESIREAQNEQLFDELLKESQIVLLKITTIFPFVLFPQDLIIGINKVDLISRIFFKSRSTRTVAIKDIAQVTVSTDLFFAAIHIIDSTFRDEPIEMQFLRKKQATKAQRIIQGLMIAWKHEVDFTKIPTDSIAEKVEELGTMHET